MPEGPELHIAARFINNITQKYKFTGPVLKSAVSTKNPDIDWNEKLYSISATARGKELKLHLCTQNSTCGKKAKQKSLPKMQSILFRFGMSGKFSFTKKDEMEKHSHLNFSTVDEDMVLSFVDYRRFGHWQVTEDWGPKRGPCVITEYESFRNNVLTHIDKRVFDKPICELLNDQNYFNGIGNYLRAEILYRLKIPPFTQARKVLEPLALEENKCEDVCDAALKVETTGKVKTTVKVENTHEDDVDILQLCHTVPWEVLKLSNDKVLYDTAKSSNKEQTDFTKWLRCYYQDDMKNLVDKNGRTIWFSGSAGPMAPKGAQAKTRGRAKKRKLIESSDNPEPQ